MRVAEGWRDYQLLDASGGERLERWGEYTLIRPDPQVIWRTERENPVWNRADAVYHRSTSGGGSWEYKKKLPNEWVVNWNDRVRMVVTPTSFKHTGVFPEQAANWAEYIRLIDDANRPISILNLFAYTGGATAACLSAGASVCHVDASRGMVEQAKRNADLSGVRDRPVRFIVDDCKKFVAREIRRGVRYDGIIMDPPSYGRGPSGEIWKIEDEIYSLVLLCADVLSEKPLFFAVNSYTTGLAPAVMKYILSSALKDRFINIRSGEIGIRVVESGLALPAGSTAIGLASEDVVENKKLKNIL